MFHRKKTDLRSASRVFGSEMALDYRARSAGCSVHGVLAALCVGAPGCPPSSEPQGGQGAEAMSPAARAPSCVPQRPPRSGEKRPGTESWGLGGWQIPTRICIFLSRLTQCENGLVVGQRPADTCLRFLISAFKAFSLDAVLAVTTI